jgi:hypothetical protein
MNLSDPPHKVSNIERMLNKYIIALFLVLISLCATGSLLFGNWLGSESTAKMWYLAPLEDTTTFNIDDPVSSSFARSRANLHSKPGAAD